MYYNNTTYQQAINAPSRRIIGNVTIKNKVISDDISSIDYVSSISGNTLTIGSTNASTVEIKFKKLIEGLEEGEFIRVSFSIKTTNSFVNRQIGEFYLTEIKLDRNNKTTSLKAIDKMGFLNDEYQTNLGYPTLGKNIVQDIASKCDLKVNNNLNITNLPSFSKKLEKVTYREALGYIAQTVGAFVTFNNNGELEFRKLTRTDKRIAKSSYMLKGLEVDEIEYRINGISVDLKNQEKTILAVGSPLGTQVKLSNPIMTQGWLNNIFSEYGKLRFNPFKLNWRGDPFVEVGDWVSIEIANGSYRAFPILELKLSYNGGLKSTIGANVKGTATSSTEYKGTVERQIEFINARLGATGNLVYADTVEPKNPKEGDTWFKPNGAFTELYIYEGDKWVLKTSTGDVDGLVTKITDSSVTTKNLAAAIGKIIELDANRITTGALSFDRLSSDTVKQIRNGLMTETKFNSYVNDENGIRQQMGTEIERVIKSKASELKGRDGIDGRPGRDGVDSYIHRKYSKNANGEPMSDDSNLDFIGIYTGRSATPPTNANQYTWSRIKGRDGANGVPGAKGADGRTSYFHTAYANSQDGRQGFSTTDGFNKIYVGTYSDFTEADSTDPTKYTWTKIKGDDGRNGRDGVNGRNGDSFARNYLAGTAEEKVFTAVNDNFVTQEAFKLVDNKTIRNLGFKLGEKITFACDYEVVPNGSNKKISDLNFEWYDTNQYRVWMDSISNPIKGELVRTIAVTNDLLDCTRLFLRCDRVNAKIKISNARLIKSDKAEPWTIAQEDLRGESNYIHRKYSNNANGSGMSDNYNQNYIGIYTGFSKTPPTNPNEYTWSRIKGQDGANGAPGARGADGRTSYLHTAYANSADGRRDFSTTDSNREYLGTYSDFTEADSTDPGKYSWTKVKGAQGVTPNPNLLLNTEIKSLDGINQSGSRPNNIKINPNDYNGHNSLEWKETGLSSPNWRGFLFKSNIKKFKKGDNIVVRIPVYIFSDVSLSGDGFSFEMKNHARNESIFYLPLHEGTPFNKWVVKEYKLIANRDFEFSSDDWAYFWIYSNGHVKIAEPYIGYGDEVPGSWSPAVEDLQGHSLTASLRFEGTYINNVTNNVKVFVDVFYDGQKINSGFDLNWKYNGGNRTTWSGFIGNTSVNGDGYIPAINWGNGNQNGTPLECIVSVSYKGLNALASGRMENMPDIVEIKETVKKYKTFDSTLEQFNSTIGEIREQAINGGRNLILNSGKLDDKKLVTYDENWIYKVENGVLIAENTSNSLTTGFGIELTNILFNLYQGETMTWSIDIRSSRSIKLDMLGFVTNGGKSNVQLNGNWQRVTQTFVNKKNIQRNDSNFLIFNFDGFNLGDKIYIRFPKLEKGTLATDWTPAPEDINLVAERLQSSIKQTKDQISLTVQKNIGNTDYLAKENLFKNILMFNDYTILLKKFMERDKFYTLYFEIDGVQEDIQVKFRDIILKDGEIKLTPNKKIYKVVYKIKNNPSNYILLNSLYEYKLKRYVNITKIVVLEGDFSEAKEEWEDLKMKIEDIYAVKTQLTLVQEGLKIAWSNKAKYFQFEDEHLAIYENLKTANNKRMQLDDQGSWFYRDGYTLGKIGTNVYKEDNSKKGLVFDLESDGAYMSWAARTKKENDTYTMIWTYTNDTVGKYTKGRLNADCDIDMHWNYLRNVKVDLENFGTGGISGTIKINHYFNKSGDTIQWRNGTMVFKNGILIKSTT